MKLIRKNNKKGFTLVELVVVIAILAILALILFPAISGYVQKADKSALEASARSLHTKAVMHIAEDKEGSLESALRNDLSDNHYIKVTSDVNDDGKYSFTVQVLKKKGMVTVDQNGIKETNMNAAALETKPTD